jgi:hypothetical protein
VYVTGRSSNGAWTIGYNRSLKHRLWDATFPGMDGNGIAVSPDGSGFCVTGTGGLGFPDYYTVGYDAADGAQRWAATYGTSGPDNAFGIDVSPDGKRVYVSGEAGLSGDFLTVAYGTRSSSASAAQGDLMWSVAVLRARIVPLESENCATITSTPLQSGARNFIGFGAYVPCGSKCTGPPIGSIVGHGGICSPYSTSDTSRALPVQFLARSVSLDQSPAWTCEGLKAKCVILTTQPFVEAAAGAAKEGERAMADTATAAVQEASILGSLTMIETSRAPILRA